MMRKIYSIEEAWLLFTKPMMRHLRGTDHEGVTAEEQSEDDEALAYFIRMQGELFEARLIEGIGELAATKDEKGISDLSHLLSCQVSSEGSYNSLIGKSMSVLDPLTGLKFCGLANWHHYDALTSSARENVGHWTGYFARRYRGNLASTDLTPELRHGSSGQESRDILPSSLEGMSPADIQAAIEKYVGAPIESVEARLFPGHSSVSGFLAEGERLAQVIWNDATKLRELGVDRHALVERIRELCQAHDAAKELALPVVRQVGGNMTEEQELVLTEYRRISRSYVYEEEAPLQVTTMSYMGSQPDPFYTRHLGSNGTFVIRNPRIGPESVLQGGCLTLSLISSLCFFEGNVPDRIDPENAARVLGFIK